MSMTIPTPTVDVRCSTTYERGGPHIHADCNTSGAENLEGENARLSNTVRADYGSVLDITDVINNLVQNEPPYVGGDNSLVDSRMDESEDESDRELHIHEGELQDEESDDVPVQNQGTGTLALYNPPGMSFYSDVGDLDKFVVTERGSPTRLDFWDEHSGGIRKNMRFTDKEQLMMAVRLWSMEQCREFKVDESRSTAWKVTCLRADQGCRWHLRACLKKTHKTWEITKFVPEHTCTSTSSSNDHRHLQSKIIARRILHFIKDNVHFSVKQIRAHVKETLHYDVTYKKGWLARCKAIEMVFGDWPTNFTQLPRFMAALVEYNQGTVVVWGHHPYSNPNVKTFGYMFFAFKPAVDGFKSCRPVLSVDGTHLHGPYKAKILHAVGQDANNHIFPLAYAYVDEETNDSWNWFLYLLREHVIGDRQVCLVSDRHKGIMNAMTNQRL